MKRTMRKRWLSAMVAFILLITTAMPAYANADPYIGDVNMDGNRDSVDLRLMLRYAMHGGIFSDEQKQLGDFDGDAAVTSTDARLAMLRFYEPDPDYIPLSGFEDVTNAARKCVYTMQAEYTDTYTFSCPKASSITVHTDTGYVQGTTSVKKTIVAGEWCDITVTGYSAGAKVAMTVTPQTNYYRLPYEPHHTIDPTALPTTGTSANPLTAASLEYTRREAGRYIYLNNPEKLQYTDIGQAIQRDRGLTGDVEITWEHSNATGQSIYLGYQLKNEGDTDVCVTVFNVGLQVSGEWLGQQSWSDYYNRPFDLPDDYFDAYGNESARYEGQDFIDYTPRVYQPTTYKIPAGKYIYAVGGSTYDAYNNTSVANTANRAIQNGRCTNAVSKFHVTGGEVTGTFYCYTDCSQVWKEPAQQGFITVRDGTDFGSQYKGAGDHQGLLESNLLWTINDSTPSQNLPVQFTTGYDKTSATVHTPYVAYNNTPRQVKTTTWSTNINPQVEHSAVGSDMLSFTCVTPDGKTVVIGPDHADQNGEPSNIANWMVDYQDNMTFVNQGNRTRYVTINKNAYGALMAMVLDREGQLLKAKCTIRPITESPTAVNYELYTLELPPHSVTQITVNFLLMGNSYGHVRNWVTLT